MPYLQAQQKENETSQRKRERERERDHLDMECFKKRKLGNKIKNKKKEMK